MEILNNSKNSKKELINELPIIPMNFISKKMEEAGKFVKGSFMLYDPQEPLAVYYDSLIQEAQNASYSEYAIGNLSTGKFGIAEYGAKKEREYVMLSDKLYAQQPNLIGWAYGLGGFGVFSFDPETGIRHDTCRIVSIENTPTEKASVRYSNFLEAVNTKSPEPIKNRKEFIDGIWFAVQHMVVVRDMPTIAAGIVKEANLTLSNCEGAQKRSGLFNVKMKKFIKEELA